MVIYSAPVRNKLEVTAHCIPHLTWTPYVTHTHTHSDHLHVTWSMLGFGHPVSALDLVVEA